MTGPSSTNAPYGPGSPVSTYASWSTAASSATPRSILPTIRAALASARQSVASIGRTVHAGWATSKSTRGVVAVHAQRHRLGQAHHRYPEAGTLVHDLGDRLPHMDAR